MSSRPSDLSVRYIASTISEMEASRESLSGDELDDLQFLVDRIAALVERDEAWKFIRNEMPL